MRTRLPIIVVAILAMLTGLTAAAAAPRGAAAEGPPQPAGPREQFYDAAGQLAGMTAGASGAAAYRYDDAGNLLSTERIAADGLAVFAVVPARGPVGATVEISGTGFAAEPAGNTVAFDGVAAEVTAASPNRLSVVVPAGTTDGAITVAAAGKTATSPRPFIVAAATPRPTITAVSTDRGNRNDVVTITGTGFDPDRTRDVVLFHRTQGQVTAATATTLTVRIPPAASSGRITVRTPGGSATSESDFLVSPRGFLMADLVYAGTIAAGQPASTVDIPAGKAALLLLAGQAGERINLTLDTNTIPVRSALWMFNPYGGNFGRQALGDPLDLWTGGRLSQDLPTLTTTGLYSIVLEPNDDVAGSVRVTASHELTGSRLTRDGDGVPFQITVAQQPAEFPFAATAGEWISFGLTDISEPRNSFLVKAIAPDGSFFQWRHSLTERTPTMVMHVAQTGTYRLTVTFGADELGGGKVWLSSVINGERLVVNGAGTPIRITRPGQSVRLPFTGSTGQVLGLGYTDNTLADNDRPQFPTAIMAEPDDVQVELINGWAETRDIPTLRKNGEHNIFVSGWQAVGTATAWLSTAGAGGPIGVNTAKQVTVDRAGKDVYLDYDGVAGRPLFLASRGSSIPGGTNLRLLRPDGQQVLRGRTIDVAALPTTGRYRIQVDPETPGTGAVTVTAAEPVDLGQLAIDGPVVDTAVGLPGQRIVGRFTAQAGQRLSLGIPSELPLLRVRIVKPDGAELGFFGQIDTRFGVDLPAVPATNQPAPGLPATGEYRLELTPVDSATGAVSVLLSTEADAGTAEIGGPAVPMAINRNGQNGKVAFAGTAGETLTFTVSEITLAGWYTVYSPDGTVLVSHRTLLFLTDTLPVIRATGVHTWVFDPQGTGSLRIAMARRTPAAAPSAVKEHPVPPRAPKCTEAPAPTGKPGGGAPDQAGQPRAATPEPAPRQVTPGCERTSRGGWQPDVHNLRGGDWNTRYGPLPPQPALLSLPAGSTGVVGRVLSTAGAPLADVTVSVGERRVHTDAAGRFALGAVPGGHLALRVDGRTASTAQRSYGVFDIGVDVTAGHVLALPYTVFLPQLDTTTAVRVPSPTRRETVLTTRAIPGLEVHIPAGTVIRDVDGKVVRKLSLTAIPVDRPPFPLPPTRVPVYFTAQPGGAVLFPQGARIVYPNYTKEPPGTRTQFWNYDPDGRGWHVYGYGTVSRNGKQIVPDANVRFYRLTGAMTAVPGLNPAPIAPRFGPRIGDPVDPSTGLLVDETVDLTVDDLMPIQIKRTYQQGDPDIRAFGVGTNFDFGLFPWSPGQIGNFDFSQFDLIQPDGSKIHYHRASPGSDYAGAVFNADPTPTQYDGSTVRWNGDGWDVTLRDGTVLVLGDEAPVQAIRDKYGNTTTITRAKAAPWTDGKVRLNGAITQITSPSGRWVKFEYGPGNPPRISAVEDNAGRRVEYTYDSTGRLSTVKDLAGGTTRYTWRTGLLESITDPKGNRFLLNTYDAKNRVKTQTAADGGVTTFDYTEVNGTITETRVTDPRGNVRRYTFNAAGAVLTDTRAFGTDVAQTTTTEYDASGVRPIATVDALGRRTAYAYDDLGQVRETTLLAGTPQARTERWERAGPHGELTRHTDPYGGQTSYELDPRGAVRSMTDPAGRKTTFETDGAGLVRTITDPAGKVTRTDYAGADPVAVTDPLGRVSRSGYDALGRVVRAVDPRGAATDTAYTARGQVRSSTDPLGRTTTLGYDANGNLETVTDPRGGLTRYEHDAMDRVHVTTDPAGGRAVTDHDRNGNPVGETSRRGVVTEHDYDALDRRSVTRYGSESAVTYGYDAGNRLRRSTDSVTGVSTVDYDDLDRPTAETTPAGAVTYAYAAGTRDRTVTAAGSPPLRYGYDAAGDLLEIRRDATVVEKVDRDGVGRPTRVGAPTGGIAQTYGYDDAGQVRSITYRSGDTVLGDLTYSYDGAGNPVTTTGSWSRAQLPEPFGPATYDAANRLRTVGDTEVSYDADGNLTSDGTATYTWNARGQLSGLSRPGLTAQFGYLPDGRRLSRTVGDTATGYVYDGANPMQEKAGGVVTATTTATGLDGWAIREAGGSARRYLTDAVGSTLALVDDTGAGPTYQYEPFGTTDVTGDDGGNPYRFTGRADDGTGLYFYRNRYYSPTLQRFLSEDPLGLGSGDANPYAYVENQPTVRTDPMGTKPVGSGGTPPGLGSGTNCVANSFTPDTPVLLADGSRRRIADVRLGDKVLATDPATGRTEGRAVTGTITGTGDKHLVDVSVDADGDGAADGTVTATEGHPFWVAKPGEWRTAGELARGDLLRTSAGTWVQVTAVASRTAAQRVHNLTVDGLHTYYVLAGDQPLLVHNCGESPVLLGRYGEIRNYMRSRPDEQFDADFLNLIGTQRGPRGDFTKGPGSWNWTQNKRYIDDAIASGREIRLVTDPYQPQYAGGNVWQRELKYLKDRGYGFEQVGDHWVLTRVRP